MSGIRVCMDEALFTVGFLGIPRDPPSWNSALELHLSPRLPLRLWVTSPLERPEAFSEIVDSDAAELGWLDEWASTGAGPMSNAGSLPCSPSRRSRAIALSLALTEWATSGLHGSVP